MPTTEFAHRAVKAAVKVAVKAAAKVAAKVAAKAVDVRHWGAANYVPGLKPLAQNPTKISVQPHMAACIFSSKSTAAVSSSLPAGHPIPRPPLGVLGMI